MDLSPRMLALSQTINPGCEHLEGDMRSVRLGREFDCVFVHDAVEYMTTEADLRAAIATARAHCRTAGVALFVPDSVRETFAPGTHRGGHDGPDGRGLRYLEWTTSPGPTDTTYNVDYAGGGNLAGFINSLDQTMKLDWDKAVPGHGAEPWSKAQVKAFRDKLQTLLDRARASVKAGTPKDRFVASLKAEDLWPFPAAFWNAARTDGLWAEAGGK